MFVNVSLIVNQLLVTIILMLIGLVVNIKQMLMGADLCDCVDVRHKSVQY